MPIPAQSSPSPRKRHTLELFAGLPAAYDRMGAVLSFGQDPRWRRALLEAIDPRPGQRILDVATGTGLVAAGLAERGADVVGLDQSEQMLEGARRRLAARARPGCARTPCPGRGGAASVRGRRVRRPELHVPAALRRRSGGDDARAGARGQAGRTHRDGRVRRPAVGAAARAVAGVHAGRPPAPRPSRLAGVGRRRSLPGSEHRTALRRRARPGRALADRRDRARSASAA